MKIQYHSMFFLPFLLTPTLCIVYAGSRRDSLEISKSERVERLLLPPAVQVRCGKWVCARGALHREWTRLHSSRVEAVLSGVGRWRPDYQLNFAPTTCCFPYTMFSLTMAASSKTFQISCLSYHSLLPSRNTLDLSFLYHY